VQGVALPLVVAAGLLQVLSSHPYWGIAMSFAACMTHIALDGAPALGLRLALRGLSFAVGVHALVGGADAFLALSLVLAVCERVAVKQQLVRALVWEALWLLLPFVLFAVLLKSIPIGPATTSFELLFLALPRTLIVDVSEPPRPRP